MDEEQIRRDEQGIPVLEDVVDPDSLPAATASPEAVDLDDHEQVAQLLQQPAVQQLVDDLAEDLQKLITWKLESFLKEEISRLVHSAAEQSAPKLAEDIHTQLQLALPDLLAKITEQARTQEP
ncbi:MAG: hypothetical protein J5I92_08160 [Thiogranum sp.]|nr:hypothetical protein [Thiogranum sp.]